MEGKGIQWFFERTRKGNEGEGMEWAGKEMKSMDWIKFKDV